LAIFAQNLALYNKNNRVLLFQALCYRFPWKFDVQTSYKPSNIVFVVNIKFDSSGDLTPIVPSTEELCCLNMTVPAK